MGRNQGICHEHESPTGLTEKPANPLIGRVYGHFSCGGRNKKWPNGPFIVRPSSVDEPSYLAESQQGSTSVFSYINIFIYVHKRF